jgi:hypothetical protein
MDIVGYRNKSNYRCVDRRACKMLRMGGLSQQTNSRLLQFVKYRYYVSMHTDRSICTAVSKVWFLDFCVELGFPWAPK